MLNDSIKVKGDLHIIHKMEDGSVKEYDYKNLVVHTGKSLIASRLVDAADAVISHMAVGTATALPVSTNTALGAEIGRAVLLSTARVENVVTYTANFAPGVGTGPLTEAGLFNDATTGIMLSRTVYPVINKGALDELTVIWNLTIQ